ncbi:hypothetical protein RJ641_025912 [Dillenia turbinata]|uniref:Calmodulin-binding family protein n=1 Tax=Dillenia turbinata TaxID=194707 RepID=A0AAN8W2G1_9MAGN
MAAPVCEFGFGIRNDTENVSFEEADSSTNSDGCVVLSSGDRRSFKNSQTDIDKPLLDKTVSFKTLVLDKEKLVSSASSDGKIKKLDRDQIPTLFVPQPEVFFSPRPCALDKSVAFKSLVQDHENLNSNTLKSMPTDLVLYLSPKPAKELNAAAVKLQKFYKSYRTSRNLADCAVIVEELWWKAMDFAALKHSSVSFFNVEKHETAVSRWARARTRVAKVGKGLSKDEKAQKLALQHWLEAKGREAYEVIIDDGKLIYKQSGNVVQTIEGSKWIFVLSTMRALYVGQKKKGTFQHSSFPSGAAITAAGRLVARDGVLEAIWPYSGHYHPTEENFREFINFLEEHHVDLTNVKRLSCRWTTGAGPRIGCVRDYPTELQFRALEQVRLSPRVTPGPFGNVGPIPSPRPSPKVRMSPRLASYMGLPSPRTPIAAAN